MTAFANAPGPRSGAFRLFDRSLSSALLMFALLPAIIAPVGCKKAETRADIIILNGAEPESLDPAIVTGQPDGRIAGALYEGLTRLSAQHATPEPAIADRWEISPDGTIYTFHIRSNACWSTGQPITAKDVVYSWRRVADPATASDYAGQMFFVKNAEAINTAKIKDVTQLGVTALDDRTVRVELTGPTPFFLDLCAFRTLAIVPQWWIEKHGDRWLMEQPVPTSGTHTLEYWRIQDRIRVRRNPHHWDFANIRNELVDFLPIENAITALNLYESKQADIIWDKNLVPTELMDALRNRKDMHVYDYLGTYFFRFNVTRKPFNDVRVRKAMAMAINKQRFVEKIVRSGEKVATSLTPPGTANYSQVDGIGYDPVQARKLLAEAGYPGGQGFPPFTYLYNTAKMHEQIAVEMQQMWKQELGITMEVKQTEWKTYLAAQSALDFDLSRSSWIGDYNDANTFLDMFMSNNGNNRTGWKSKRYDDLMNKANQTTDPKKREMILREAETILVREELPFVPLFFYVGVNFFDPEKIDGVYFNLLDEHPVHALRKRK